MASLESFGTFDKVDSRFKPLGVIGSGAYGVVHKAERLQTRNGRRHAADERSSRFVAVKQMKSLQHGIGIPLDAYREIKILKADRAQSESKLKTSPQALHHPNLVSLEHVFISSPKSGESAALSLVFDYAEHDLSELIRYHRRNEPCHRRVLKSLMWQLLSGVAYLHQHWVLHRDLKPANILIMGPGPDHGRVKIGDFGLARLFKAPLRKLADDGDVVTIWYRAPELLLGSQHYTPAVDMWALGCIFAEIILAQPLFPGEEVKTRRPPDKIAFQADQLKKIIDLLGRPTPEQWPAVAACPFYSRVAHWGKLHSHLRQRLTGGNKFKANEDEVDLIAKMLLFDPNQRITAAEALEHQYFTNQPYPHKENAFRLFNGQVMGYPARKLKQEHPLTAAKNNHLVPAVPRGRVRVNNAPSRSRSRKHGLSVELPPAKRPAR